MDKIIVLLDSDGVIMDLASAWCKAYNEQYQDNVSVEAFIGYKDLEKQVKCGNAVFDIIKQPGFFNKLQPAPDAVESLERLAINPKLDCYILTAFSGNAEIAYGKMQSLPRVFPFFDPEKIILCKPKFLVYGNVLVDDSFENLINWSAFQSNNALHDHHTLFISQDASADKRNKVDAVIPSITEAAEYIENILL
jgi:5'(3')-deoxyribonucleotidase